MLLLRLLMLPAPKRHTVETDKNRNVCVDVESLLGCDFMNEFLAKHPLLTFKWMLISALAKDKTKGQL